MNNNLKNLREKAGFTQAEAADLMGMSKGGYIKIEHGHRRLTADHIARAAEVFKTSEEQVLKRRESPAAKKSAAETATFFKTTTDADRFFAALEGILEGLGLEKGRGVELKSMFLEATELDLGDLEQPADFEARRAVARAKAKKFADKEGIHISEKSRQK